MALLSLPFLSWRNPRVSSKNFFSSLLLSQSFSPGGFFSLGRKYKPNHGRVSPFFSFSSPVAPEGE